MLCGGEVLHAEVDPRVGACSLPPAFARGVGRTKPCRACAAPDAAGPSSSRSVAYGCTGVAVRAFILGIDKTSHRLGQLFSFSGKTAVASCLLCLCRGVAERGSCGQGCPRADPRASLRCESGEPGFQGHVPFSLHLQSSPSLFPWQAQPNSCSAATGLKIGFCVHTRVP